MNDNKGISLIEMLLVLVILALLVSAAVGGIHYINYGNTKECANKIDLALSEVRIDDLSRDVESYLYIYKYNNCYYLTESRQASPVLDDTGIKLGNGQISLWYRTSSMASGDSDIKIDGGTSYMKIGFEKGTGGVMAKPGATSDYYNRILVKNHGETEARYTIVMVQATGKHFIQ